MTKLNPEHDWLFNDGLARDRGCDLEALQKVYIKLHKVLENPLEGRTHEEVVAVIEALEATLQKLWGFEPDPNYHSYWHEVEGCSCPSMDNRDPLFRGRRIINMSCPFHGKGVDKAN